MGPGGSDLIPLQRSIHLSVTGLGGVDALVFTGGIGERAASVRAEICDGLDRDLNASAHPDAIVSSTAFAGRILTLTARGHHHGPRDRHLPGVPVSGTRGARCA